LREITHRSTPTNIDDEMIRKALHAQAIRIIDQDMKERISTITSGIITIQDRMNKNLTGIGNTNIHTNNRTDDRHTSGWNLESIIILSNHHEKARGLQLTKIRTTSIKTKTSTSTRPSPLHPATTSPTKHPLMTTTRIFRSTATSPTWKSSSNTEQQMDRQSSFKSLQEADPRSHKIANTSPSTKSK
jgi:hypothetical protein